MKESHQNIKFREPENIDELESLFRLRYIVYSEDPVMKKLLHSSSPLDINRFDLNALHFAGFVGSIPVAYMRITTNAETHFTGWINTILEKNNIVLEQNSTEYPFQSYCNDEAWYGQFLSGLNGRKIGEVGRLAIHKEHRRGGAVLEDLIRSFIHYCKEEQRFDTGFGSCTLLLERYYSKFGFTRAENAVPFTYKELPEAVIVRFDR